VVTDRKSKLAALVLAVAGFFGAVGTPAEAASRPSYLRVFNGPLWVGPHIRGTHHYKYIFVALRDPVKPAVYYPASDPRWNCFIDAQFCPGNRYRARGFISAYQNRRYFERFRVDDICLYDPHDKFGAVECADGRTYVTYDKWRVSA